MGGGEGGAVLIFPFLNCGPIHLQWLFENYQMNYNKLQEWIVNFFDVVTCKLPTNRIRGP